MENKDVKRLGLNSWWLKWIAVMTMVIDHTGAILFPQILILRLIGRLSFPIFCFLIVEGFVHTRNVKRYIVRLGIFALMSELPFDMAFRGKWVDFAYQNVFFTLFISVVLLYVIQKTNNPVEKILFLIIAMWAAMFLQTDYSGRGVLLIFWFYVMREKKGVKLLGGVAWNFLKNYKLQSYGALSMLILALYNGERGPKMKYFFYLFYLGHLLILWQIGIRVI